ncbi:hypothetical protein DAI22_01g396150 [Oryza sativa Japonica Group]|nr:hypothetical protein DAI22_01g396150 [Oryza sativa Japonica Group]
MGSRPAANGGGDGEGMLSHDHRSTWCPTGPGWGCRARASSSPWRPCSSCRSRSPPRTSPWLTAPAAASDAACSSTESTSKLFQSVFSRDSGEQSRHTLADLLLDMTTARRTRRPLTRGKQWWSGGRRMRAGQGTAGSCRRWLRRRARRRRPRSLCARCGARRRGAGHGRIRGRRGG